MPAKRFDIEVAKGFLWEALLTIPGRRFISADFRGQMRADALSATVLASFQFSIPAFNQEKNQTEVRVWLPTTSTQSLPATEELPLVYDLQASLLDGTAYLLLAGYVQVWATVTRR